MERERERESENNSLFSFVIDDTISYISGNGVIFPPGPRA